MLKKCCEKLEYSFHDFALLELALSHRSAGRDHNERFEFLGDAILNFVMAEALFHLFPKASEGELTRYRASLVNKKTLLELAKECDLGRYLRLGFAELKNPGGQRDSILADAVEAVIGAIYLDGGMTRCQAVILSWYASRLEAIAAVPVDKDSKTQLQEYFQARHLPLPRYVLTLLKGKAHAQVFHVECHVAVFNQVTQGHGSSLRDAQKMAAKAYLELIR